VKLLEQRVLHDLGDSRLLAPGDRMGVAVSGGADSVALLRLLYQLRAALGVTLLVVHFDHGLRGAESQADAEFVADLARTRGLSFILEREDVAAAAARNKWNLEDAARRLRYEFFDRVVREGRATRIAVAHTADDQAETVLAHLLRGSGPAGLAAIYPVAGSVVRPLLGVRREELRSYLRERGQAWREDSTNLDVRRLRARIRASLVPLLERDFSPRIVGHLARLAGLAREEEQFWQALIDQRFRALVRRDDAGLSIRVGDLIAPMDFPRMPSSTESSQPSSEFPQRVITERLIRRMYQELHGSRQGLTARHVQQVISLAERSGSGRRAELPGGIGVEKNFAALTFSRRRSRSPAPAGKKSAAESAAYAYPIELPAHGCATVSVPELQRRFRMKVIDWTNRERDTKTQWSALDADRLRPPLILRSWRAGDAYRPLGRRQSHKLKQMFTSGRIPVQERVGWPVLESNGRIVWTRGMPPAQEFCVRQGTTTGLVVEEETL
jgi:tRNA(Ile)-lysidine synthase